MNKYYQDNDVTIYNGNVLDNDLPDESVQMVVTSPPYWGLRKYAGEQELLWGGDKHCQHEWVGFGDVSDVRKDEVVAGKSRTEERFYGGDETRKFNGQHQKHYQDNTCSICGAWKGAYGLEPTPEMYVEHTVEILREIRRVLRKDGVVFWNIGDSYASKAGGYSDNGSRGNSSVISAKTQAAVVKGKRIARGSGRWGGGNNPSSGHLKEKDLCLIPFRVAIAAQEDGWWVRSVIIWQKPNPMPESVTDRPTESHEYILMLTKSARYYWDAEAVRESRQGNTHSRGKKRAPPIESAGIGHEDWCKYMTRDDELVSRNIRSVWDFATQPYPEAHFAVFPEKLPELCIKAATPEAGCCAKCGAPWARVIEKTGHINKREAAHVPGNTPTKTDSTGWAPVGRNTNSWKPTCKCKTTLQTVPAVVLDPFQGAGTTLWVAKNLNRKAIGFDISEEYCELAVDRNRQQVLMIKQGSAN